MGRRVTLTGAAFAGILSAPWSFLPSFVSHTLSYRGAALPVAAAPRRPGDGRMPETSPRILIADDDASVRRLIELVLRKSGYRLTFVANGLHALEHLQAETPDLVICDLHMPEMSGFDLLSAIQRTPGLARLPVIVVTAAGQPKDVERALKLGAAACVFKPFAQAQFQALVRDTLAARR